MRHIWIISALTAVLSMVQTSAARGQSNPGIVAGSSPSSAQWNSFFSRKMDYPLTSSSIGAVSLFASPPPLGSTVPSSGAFTTLTASGSVSGAGFTSLFASPPAIGSTTPAAGSFTTLSSFGSATLNSATVTSILDITGSAGNAVIRTPNATNLQLVPQGGGIVRTIATSRSWFLSVRGDLDTPPAWNGGSAEGVSAIYANAGNISGTDNGVNPAAIFYYPVVSDTRICTGGNACPGMMLDYNIGGSAMRGGRNGFLVQMTQTDDIVAQAGGIQQYTAGSFQIATNKKQGGTGVGDDSRGVFYGLNPQVIIGSNVDYLNGANAWGEGDISNQSTTTQTILGQSTVLLANHTYAAPVGKNVGYLFGAQQGAVATWDINWAVGGTVGPWPNVSTSTIMGTAYQNACGGDNRNCQMRPELATYGVDWQYVNFSQQSGYSFHGPGFAVDGTGQLNVGNTLATTVTATGAQLDVPNTYRVTSVAIATAGTASGNSQNNFWPDDIVYGTGTPSIGQYKVTHTKVLAAVVTAGGTGGTPGAVTITGTTGTGTKFQATGTINGGGVLAGALVVTVVGDYTVNPTTPGAEPVTGGGLTGTTINIGIGVLTATILVPDVFNGSCPGSITSIGGSGAGLVLTPTCSVRDGIIIAGASTKLGFFDATPAAKPTGVPVTAADIHAALVTLGLIAP